ncbi:hypothetical protein HNP83_000280 [Rhizobium leguminosarum]|nr:hypothetical protein [Rhizobium leguminosarum]
MSHMCDVSQPSVKITGGGWGQRQNSRRQKARAHSHGRIFFSRQKNIAQG